MATYSNATLRKSLSGESEMQILFPDVEKFPLKVVLCLSFTSAVVRYLHAHCAYPPFQVESCSQT